MTAILVACVGNIFNSDDGFGSAVAAELGGRTMPPDVRLEDFGIRSVHLVYELLSGYDVLLLVDTVGRQQGPPGTLFVLEPDLAAHPSADDDPLAGVLLDAHDLSPGGAMALVPALGGSVERILVVGCQPGTLDEGIGLSDEVRAAVVPAADLVEDVLRRELDRLHAPSETAKETP